MKLPGLINLGLILIMASNSKGEGWSVNVTRRINATLGSNVTIPCTFTYPTKFLTKDVWWKMNVKSPIEISDNDQHAFIFHRDDSYVIEKYRGRTKLIGNKTAGNCTLQISNVMENVQKIYLRISGNEEKWSFRKEEEFVSIFVSSPGVSSVTVTPGNLSDITAVPQPVPTSGTVSPQSASTYTAIFVPVAVILVILFVIGIFFYIRHKRSQSFTREESGYYANFSRASSNQAEREASCNKQENKNLPEVKATDEPIYINTEAPLDQMDQSMDDMDNVYANVDYTK